MYQFNTVEEALEELKNGKIILKENKREHEILLGGQNNKKDFLNTIRILFFT